MLVKLCRIIRLRLEMFEKACERTLLGCLYINKVDADKSKWCPKSAKT